MYTQYAVENIKYFSNKFFMDFDLFHHLNGQQTADDAFGLLYKIEILHGFWFSVFSWNTI